MKQRKDFLVSTHFVEQDKKMQALSLEIRSFFNILKYEFDSEFLNSSIVFNRISICVHFINYYISVIK